MIAKTKAAAALLATILVWGGPASAGPTDTVKPGRQATPPAPPQPTQNPGPVDARQRRAIRGCPVDLDCHSVLIRGLEEFERETFPKPNSKSPWRDDDDQRGHNAVRNRFVRRGDNGRNGPPGLTARHDGKRDVVDPTKLRPDLKWLSKLEMPDIPVHWNDRIIRYLEFYKDDPRGRRIMSGWLKSQGKYRNMILRELRAADLPEDLLYIAMIESSYKSRTLSYAGASGLWQLMPAGGKIYGLKIGRWIDERNDPVLATKAVTGYFADLYHRFGNWDLALAAYNAGYGAVLKGMAKYNTNDFWRLLDFENGLPWESSNYVPKALATAIVGHNRKLFGYDNVKADAALLWDTVTVPKSVALSIIARAAGVNKEEVARLNPQLRRKRTPPGVKDYVVRIPRGTRTVFAERFPQLRGDWDKYDAYVVRHGERFEDIATIHGLSSYKLRKLNDLSTEAEIRGGMYLVVPKVSSKKKKANLAVAKDNLYASGIGGKPGEKLIVPVPDPSFRVKGKRRVFYRVVSGDTQYRIASVFGVDRHSLAAWNGLDAEAHLSARMVLQVWVTKSFDPKPGKIKLLDSRRIKVVKVGSDEHLDESERLIGRKRIVYTAKKRETYKTIGKKYGLTARDLARINKKPHTTTLETGETAIVYDVVDRTASDRAAKQAKSKAKANRRGKRSKRPTKRKKKSAAPKTAPVKTAKASETAKIGRGAPATKSAPKAN